MALPPFGFPPRFGALLASSLTALLLISGCGAGGGLSVSRAAAVGSAAGLSGSVHGGQQPVVGANIALYAAGHTGVASTPRPMLNTPVTSDGNGNFSLTNDYSCNPGDQVYLVATGGNPGFSSSTANPAIALMAALGPCAVLQTTAYVSVNEVTTVAGVYSLAGFMTGAQALGADYTSAPSSNALAAAFANVQTMIDPVYGGALQTSAGNGQVPYLTINSLANSLAACINSTPPANGDSSACASLFSATTVSGSTPTDTLQATLNLAKDPALNTNQIFTTASANPPFLPALTSTPANYAIAVAHPGDVLTYHNNAARTGVQSFETTLTPANVNTSHFGELTHLAVDSYLYAQPLFVGGVGMPDGVVHNLLFAASSHATLYAFDADSGAQLWSVSLIPAGERYAAAADYGGCGNPQEAGIVGTPVIDRATQTLYVVTKTVPASGTVTPANSLHRLHAISILDGSERANSPTLINPTFTTTSPGSSAGSSGSTIPFNGQTQNNRSALLLTTNSAGLETVWIAYASHCDIGPYHGLLLGSNAANVAQPVAAFNNTTNGNDGGIWMGSGGPASDANGFLYVVGGNGTFDYSTGGPDLGDTATKLLPPANPANSTAMTVYDYFTPSDQATLESTDADLGGNEAVLFSDPASGVAPNLMIVSDKQGYIYLLNRDALGSYDAGHNGVNSLNGDLQDFKAGNSFTYNFAFFNNTLYTSDSLYAYTYVPGTSMTAGYFNTSGIAGTVGGATSPVVSANGTSNGIVWAQGGDGIIHASNPVTMTDYWSSAMTGGPDVPAYPFMKFSSPVIANGKVYVPGHGGITIYGPK